MSGLAALAEAGGSMLGSAISGAVNYYGNKNLMKQQQAYTQENMRLQKQINEELARKSKSLENESLRAAGMSPALANGTSGLVSSQGAPAAGLAQFNMPDLGQSAMHGVQMELLKSQAHLAESQAQQQDIQNTRAKNADTQFAAEIKKQLQGQIDLYNNLGLDSSGLQQQYDNLVNSNIDLGAFEGSMKAFEVHSKSLETFTKRLSELVHQQTEYNKIYNDVAQDIANMPKLARDLQERLIAVKGAEAYYMMSGGDVNKANLDKIAAEVKEIYGKLDLMVKQGDLTQAQADKIKNNDIATLLDKGEYKKAFIASGVRLGEAAATGAGMAGGYAAVGAATRGGGLAGFAGNFGRAKSMLRSMSPSSPIKKVVKKLENQVGSDKADWLFETWFDQQVKNNSAGRPTVQFEEWLKNHVKSVKFMRGY